MNQDELDRRFDYHAPDEVTRYMHQEMRELTKRFAEAIEAVGMGDCREFDLFMTNLEQAQMWAHAAIARSQSE